MGSRGISNDHTVVLYGDRNNWFAAYTYWYFLYYGHDKVKLSTARARSGSRRVARPRSEAPVLRGRRASRPGPGDEAIRAKRDEVGAALDSATNLVDVRSPQEYSGELIAMAGYEQEGAQRAGHIPGAASVPWAKAVNEDGTFRSADELRELYTDAGVVEGGKPIIAYCRIGERSAHTWFVLHELLGEGDVKNYDGSWTEWGNLVESRSRNGVGQRACGRRGARGAPCAPRAAAGAARALPWAKRVAAAKRFAEDRAGTDLVRGRRRGGRLHGSHPDRVHNSASVVKVMFMVALLREPGVRHDALSAAERGLLEPMIRRSDNQAGDRDLQPGRRGARSAELAPTPGSTTSPPSRPGA